MKDIQSVATFEIRNLVYLNRMVETALDEIKYEKTHKINRNSKAKSFIENRSGYVFAYLVETGK